MTTQERKDDIEDIKGKIKVDADKAASISRFGFFSILYPAYLGDQYYSQGKTSKTII